MELNELTVKNNTLDHLNLEDAMERFEHIPEMGSKELNIMPRLDDKSADLELFLDDKDESRPLFTSPVRC